VIFIIINVKYPWKHELKILKILYYAISNRVGKYWLYSDKYCECDMSDTYDYYYDFKRSFYTSNAGSLKVKQVEWHSVNQIRFEIPSSTWASSHCSLENIRLLKMADGAACRWPPLVSSATTYAQVKDDISLSSFKIVATEGRMLTSNPPPVIPVGLLAPSAHLMNEVESFVSITRTYLQMAIQRVACRCLYWRSLEGRSVEDTWGERGMALLTAVEVLTLHIRILRLAGIVDNHVRI